MAPRFYTENIKLMTSTSAMSVTDFKELGMNGLFKKKGIAPALSSFVVMQELTCCTAF